MQRSRSCDLTHVSTRGGQSHFFRLRLRSCLKIPDPGPTIFQIWESYSCSDSSYIHRSNRNLPMFLLKELPHRFLLLPKLKSDSGSGFSQIFDSGSGSGFKRKTEDRAGVDSGTLYPVPLLSWTGVPECTPTGFFVFLSEPVPVSKICEKPGADTESIFNFGSTWVGVVIS